MKKNTKGFTLIELLAVIVILAIIALIATPIVLNLIEKARKGAAQDSAYGLRKAAELYYATALLENPNGLDAAIEFSCDGEKCATSAGDELDIDGTVPKTAKVTIDVKGNVNYENVVINNFECAVWSDGEIKCS